MSGWLFLLVATIVVDEGDLWKAAVHMIWVSIVYGLARSCSETNRGWGLWGVLAFLVFLTWGRGGCAEEEGCPDDYEERIKIARLATMLFWMSLVFWFGYWSRRDGRRERLRAARRFMGRTRMPEGYADLAVLGYVAWIAYTWAASLWRGEDVGALAFIQWSAELLHVQDWPAINVVLLGWIVLVGFTITAPIVVLQTWQETRWTGIKLWKWVGGAGGGMAAIWAGGAVVSWTYALTVPWLGWFLAGTTAGLTILGLLIGGFIAWDRARKLLGATGGEGE